MRSIGVGLGVVLATVVVMSGMSASGDGAGPDDRCTPYPRTGVDPAPLATIAGPRTQLGRPLDVERDAAGNTWVSNWSPDHEPQILVFAPDADGDVSPARIITDPGLVRPPSDLTIDDDGYVWATMPSRSEVNEVSPGGIRVYSPRAAGVSRPVRTISSQHPHAVELDGDGTIHLVEWEDEEVYLRTLDRRSNGADRRVLTSQQVDLRGAGTGNITWANPRELVGTAGSVWRYSVSFWRPGATGEQAPLRGFGGSPTETGGAVDIATDRAGNLYVAAEGGCGTVAVHANGASGNPEPLLTLGGVQRFRTISGVAVERSGRVTVSFGNFVDPRIEVFAPLMPQPANRGEPLPARPSTSPAATTPRTPAAVRPPVAAPAPLAAPRKVRAFRVTGSSRRPLLAWRAPAASGNRAARQYRIKVTRGGRTLVDRRTTARRIRLDARRLGPGPIKITVRAVNGAGPGPAITRRLRLG